VKHVIVNVATDSWVKGQNRLITACHDLGEPSIRWSNQLPPGSPPHRILGVARGASDARCVPYAFKAYALHEAEKAGNELLIWCDASVYPIRPLKPIWDYIEREGVWLNRNGFSNYEWTADSAYPDLFADLAWPNAGGFANLFADLAWHNAGAFALENARQCNKLIPHVIATAFGISTAHHKGRAFLDEYFRLASQTRAFCGPWANTNAPDQEGRNWNRPAGPCGAPDVLGHRHDQTAASVIAWRLDVPLVDPPTFFAYDPGQKDDTYFVAKAF